MSPEDLSLYERLFLWIESGEPCPPLLREQLTRAFDAYFSGAADHLEQAFGVGQRPGAQRAAQHRRLVLGAQVYRRVQQLHADRALALNKAGAIGVAAEEFGISASTAESYCKFHRSMRPHPKND